jgi:hypothetical protein
MRALLRKIILWSIPEIMLRTSPPAYDPAALDKIAAENRR